MNAAPTEKPATRRLGLALSGGGSRAMAFHLGCLRALHDLKLLEKVGVLSTISGGSVIGAYYAYTPDKSFAEFEADIRRFLRAGFQRKIARELLLNPDNFVPGLAGLLLAHAQDLVAWTTPWQPAWRRLRSRTDVFHDVLRKGLYPRLTMRSPRRQNLDVVIGATDLRTGSAFRFSNLRSGGWRHGELTPNDVEVAFAVTASAAYPIMLPAFDRKFEFDRNGTAETTRVLLTDGGIYDNLGLEVMEPCRSAQYNLHALPCDYLLVCNAGRGRDAGNGISRGFFTRVASSFEVVHRRVQESAMHHLHHLKEAGEIKGFAMPYLGQQDDVLPAKPPGFVPREEVVNYPTDFAAMSEDWIEKLARRGEQLTHVLVSAYLPGLL